MTIFFPFRVNIRARDIATCGRKIPELHFLQIIIFDDFTRLIKCINIFWPNQGLNNFLRFNCGGHAFRTSLNFVLKKVDT